MQNPQIIAIIPELQRGALRTTERLSREGDTLHYRITIDDPKIFTRPFLQDFNLMLRPDWEQPGLLEYSC